jgi:hypothetical protein
MRSGVANGSFMPIRAITALAAIVVAFAVGAYAARQSGGSDDGIKRLPPSAFKDLPALIVRQLTARGCTIPQVVSDTGAYPVPNNVIHGEFATKGQTDWAVLCSKSGKSTLLVFWAKAPGPCETSPRTADDSAFVGKANKYIYCTDGEWKTVGGGD